MLKVVKLINKSKKSQEILETIPEKENLKLLGDFSRFILSKDINYLLSKMAVLETGFGNIEDKMKKNLIKSDGLYKDLKKFKYELKEIKNSKGILKINKPVGIIVGITPSTNPIATSLNYFMNSFRCRNSLILVPNFRTYKTINKLESIIKKFLINNNLPINLITLPPLNLIKSNEVITMFDMSDKIIVTGGGDFLRSKVKLSKTSSLIFGKGNPPIILDKDINIKETIRKIVLSKSFDNSTSCSAESVLIVDNLIYKKVIKELKIKDVYLLNSKEKSKINDIFLKKGIINNDIVAKDSNVILEKIGINIKRKIKLIAYQTNINASEKFLFDEKITPILTILKSNNILQSVKISKKILEITGLGHSAGIHSNSHENILYVGKELNVSRLIVNQPHSQATGGSKRNNMKFSLSLGTGRWGGDLINDNLHYKHFVNTTKIVFTNKK